MRKQLFYTLLLTAGISLSAKAAVHPITSSADAGEGSLRALLSSAAAGDTLVLPNEMTIALDSTICFFQDIVIEGNGATIQVATPGVSPYRLMMVGDNIATPTVTIHNATLKGGNIAGTHNTAANVANCGGVVSILKSTLTLNNVTVRDGIGTYSGGIHMQDATSTLRLYGCTFTNNSTQTTGSLNASNAGAVYFKGVGVVDNCVFSNNAVNGVGNGSAIVSNAKLTINNTQIINNTATTTSSYGSAFFNTSGGVATLSNCLIANNSSNKGTGAFACSTSAAPITTTTFVNTTFHNNSGVEAGALYIYGGDVNLIHCTITGNTSTASANIGAGVWVRSVNNATCNAVSTIVAYNINNGSYADLFKGNSATFSGTHNILGNVAGTETNSITFGYSPESALFASYNGTDVKTPAISADGTVKLASNSVALASGCPYGQFDPEIIPGEDQIGTLRGIVPCVGACEYVSDPSTDVKPVNSVSVLFYPNPATETIYFTHAETIQSVRIVDLTGKVAVESRLSENSLNVRQLNSGIYIIAIETASGIQTQKLTIRK